MRALAGRLRELPLHAYALTVIVAAGIVLRVIALTAYRPAAGGLNDSIRYLDAAHDDLYSNPVHPVGYSVFLRGLRFVNDDITVTLFVQHALGVSTALLLYLAVRRLPVPDWLGVLPAAVVLLNGDQVYLEHAILSEALSTFLCALALYFAIRALVDQDRTLWLVLTGLAAAAAVITRPAVALVAAAVAVAVFGAALGWRRRVLRVSVAMAAVAIPVVGYMAITESATGTFGMSQAQGWVLYGRVAPFADCSQFTPPKGTRALCEQSPIADRPGADFYVWNAGSPARALGYPPDNDAKLAAFARAVLLHEPVYWLKETLNDLYHFVDENAGRRRPFGGPGKVELEFGRRAPEVEPVLIRAVARDYDDESFHIGGAVDFLTDYQAAVRFHGALFLICAALALAGAIAATGVLRWAVVLTGLAAFGLLLLPAATLFATSRYGVPAAGAFAMAATLGGWAVVGRLAPHARRWRALRHAEAP